MATRPYNREYCKHIDCPNLKGSWCTAPSCTHPKEIRWWTKEEERKGAKP